MMFLGPLLGVTLRNKMRSEDIQECLETRNVVQEDVGEMVPKIYNGKHIITSLSKNVYKANQERDERCSCTP